jgi:hypothetical protein
MMSEGCGQWVFRRARQWIILRFWRLPHDAGASRLTHHSMALRNTR